MRLMLLNLFHTILGLAPLLSLLLAGWTMSRIAERTAPRFGPNRSAIADVTPALLVITVVSARLTTVAPHWRLALAHPLDLVRLNGQLSFFGGAVGAVVAMIILAWRAHLPVWRVADVYAVALPLGFAVYGLGCLLRDDCYGRTARPPFGIVFPGHQVPRYPVELYAAAAALITYAGLQWLDRWRPAPGTVALATITALGTSRALLDTLRLDADATLLNSDQVASLTLAALALIVLQIRLLWSVGREPVPTHPTTPSLVDRIRDVGGRYG